MRPGQLTATLNDLLEICRDGEKGFSTAAEYLEDPFLRSVLHECAGHCADGARELTVRLLELGAHPAEGGSALGALHRSWVELKSRATGGDSQAILAECARGESVAKRRYEAALGKDLPEDVRNLVLRQYEGLLKNRHRLQHLQDDYVRPRARSLRAVEDRVPPA